jgi:hypothetical protein
MKHWILGSRELTSEVSTDMSQDRLRNEWILSQVEAAKICGENSDCQ